MQQARACGGSIQCSKIAARTLLICRTSSHQCRNGRRHRVQAVSCGDWCHTGLWRRPLPHAVLQAYRQYNARAVELGRSRGHFLVDLCRPGHMTACLRTFQETIHCNDDNWDAHFGARCWTVAQHQPAVQRCEEQGVLLQSDSIARIEHRCCTKACCHASHGRVHMVHDSGGNSKLTAVTISYRPDPGIGCLAIDRPSGHMSQQSSCVTSEHCF